MIRTKKLFTFEKRRGYIFALRFYFEANAFCPFLSDNPPRFYAYAMQKARLTANFCVSTAINGEQLHKVNFAPRDAGNVQF